MAESDRENLIAGLKALEARWEVCAIQRDSSYAKLLHVLGRSYWQNGDLDKGIQYTTQAIDLNSSGSPMVLRKELCNNYFNLGAMYAAKGLRAECINAYQKSIEEGSSFPDKQFVVSKGYKELASVFFSQGDYDKSILAAEKGYLTARKLNNGVLMSESLIEKSQSLIELSSLEEAASTLEEVMTIPDVSDAHLGAANSLLAEYNVRKKNFREAEKCYEKSYAYYKKAGFEYGCGQASVNLGYLLFRSFKNYTKASHYYERAARHFENPRDKAIVINELSRIKATMGFTKEALELNNEALRLFLPDYSDRGWIVNPVASKIREVVDKAALLNLISHKGELLTQLSKEGRDRSVTGAALATYMLADTMVDFMRWEHSGKAAKLFWRANTRSLYENAIHTAFEAGDTDKFFYFLEKSRGALLQDHMNELGAAQLISPEDQEKEANLKYQVQNLQLQLETSEDEGQRRVLRNKLFDAREALETFVRDLEQSNPAYYTYKYENRGMTIRQLREKILRPDEAFLAFFVGDSSVYMFSCNQNTSSLRKIDAGKYRSLLTAYESYLSNKAVQNQDFQGFVTASNHLYEVILGPFNIAPGVRLIVSPDGKFIPFASLSKSGKKEDFLVRSNAVSYTYSASFLEKALIEKERKLPWKSFMGMAPVEYHTNLKQAILVGSDKALEAVGRLFTFPKILARNEATKKAFLSHLGAYPIIQLFTHATADTAVDGMTTPTIFFADSSLTLNELNLQHRNQTRLLVLSACETGIGVEQRGEGVFSLARGFAEAGIPSVLTTLWSVESEAIYKITQWFYNELVDGATLDEALRRAQLQWLEESEKSGQLPFIWAGNILIGRSDSVNISYTIPILAGSFIAVILIVCLCYFVRKKRKD